MNFLFVFYPNFCGLANISKSKKNIAQFTRYTSKHVSFLTQLSGGGSLKPLGQLKLEYNLTNVLYFQWFKLKHAIPNKWKIIVKLQGWNKEKKMVREKMKIRQ